MLRKVSQFAAVVLVIAITAVPLMACMVPDSEMTAEERNCCKKMMQDCESSAMPSSHSCCQHPAVRQVASVSKIWCGNFALVPVVLVQAPIASSTADARSTIAGFESPPESPPTISTVLRI